MTVTLKPILEALGYTEAKQQRAIVTLLQAAGAFGQVEGAGVVFSPAQADAVLEHLTFNSMEHAANLLRDITQNHLIRKPGKERYECSENPLFAPYRPQLLQALNDAGMLGEAAPKRKHYDHVLLLGAMEGTVETRFATLKNLAAQGITFDKIHLLGCERPLDPEREPLAGKMGVEGWPVRTEMDMMHAQYYTTPDMPQSLANTRVFSVNTFNKPGGARANTQDTVVSWKKTHPVAGDVLVISNQPYVRYQDAAVKSVLPPEYRVETLGAPATDVNISTALDSFARQIHVNFEKLLEQLKARENPAQPKLMSLDPAKIKVDAATYQFRAKGNSTTGVTQKGRYHATKWDPILHGNPLLVHERLDGTMYVADGHHRLELAKSLNQQGTGPGLIAAMVLREADGYTPKDVRVIAAYKNIAHGKNDPVEAARVFKEAASGQVHTEFLPSLQMDKGNLRMAYTLSKLSDKALDVIEAGKVRPELGAAVAKLVPQDSVQQERVMAVVAQRLRQEYHEPKILQPTRLSVIHPPLSPPPQEKGFVAKWKLEQSKAVASGFVR